MHRVLLISNVTAKTCLLSVEGGDGLGIKHLINVVNAESLDLAIFLQAVIQGSKCGILARLWDEESSDIMCPKSVEFYTEPERSSGEC